MQDCSAFIGKTDCDFFPQTNADLYRQNYLQVMNNQTELAIKVPITLADG